MFPQHRRGHPVRNRSCRHPHRVRYALHRVQQRMLQLNDQPASRNLLAIQRLIHILNQRRRNGRLLEQTDPSRVAIGKDCLQMRNQRRTILDAQSIGSETWIGANALYDPSSAVNFRHSGSVATPRTKWRPSPPGKADTARCSDGRCPISSAALRRSGNCSRCWPATSVANPQAPYPEIDRTPTAVAPERRKNPRRRINSANQIGERHGISQRRIFGISGEAHHSRFCLSNNVVPRLTGIRSGQPVPSDRATDQTRPTSQQRLWIERPPGSSDARLC